MNAAGLTLVSGIFVLVSTMTWALAPKTDKRVALGFVLAGLVASALKIAVFQQAPQWQDINPDSITYERNARAFVAHWRGKALPAEQYNLRGLKNFHAAGLHGPEWEPNDHFTYARIIGSHEWLYAAYVGLWYWLSGSSQALVISSNALWAALFPAAAFGIALALGAPKKWALAAGALALLDPSAGVNASWLLKDTLAGFLAMAVLWALTAYLREGGMARLLVAALALGLLGGVRYVAFLGLMIAVMLIAAWILVRRGYARGAALICTLAVSAAGFGVIYSAPQSVSPAQRVSPAQIVLPVKDSFATLLAKKGDMAADDTVLRWKNSLAENLPLAIVKSAAHTLFAPYPWVAIHPGLTWRSFSELYYPGVLLWILCLPGIFLAIAIGLRREDPAYWLVLLFLASQLAAYTIWQGEWSTRQRVFALPAFFALAAIGWHRMIAWWRSRQPAAGRAA